MDRFEMFKREELVETAGLLLERIKEFAKSPETGDPKLMGLQFSGMASLVRYYQALGNQNAVNFAIARTVLDDEALKQHYLHTSTPALPGVKKLRSGRVK